MGDTENRRPSWGKVTPGRQEQLGALVAAAFVLTLDRPDAVPSVSTA